MSDEQKLREGHERGVLAEQVINNRIFQEALVIIKGDLMLKFENTDFTQRDVRDEIWREMNTLAKIEKQLKKVMKNGKLCEQELSMLQKLKNKVGF